MKHSKKNKQAVKEYPSSFGSHLTMLSDDYKEFNDVDTNPQPKCVCKDERGNYVTNWKSLDSGICDGNRIATVAKRKQGILDLKL